MSERTLILSEPQNIESARSVKPISLGGKIFSFLNKKYDQLIDVLFKWTN
jgi:hypothetical protein